MPILTGEEAKTLKAQVTDLNEAAAKEALFGMIQILNEHPSILTAVFMALISDSRKLSKWEG